MTNIWILKQKLHNLAIEKGKAKNKRDFLKIRKIELVQNRIKDKIEELREKKTKRK